MGGGDTPGPPLSVEYDSTPPAGTKAGGGSGGGVNPAAMTSRPATGGGGTGESANLAEMQTKSRQPSQQWKCHMHILNETKDFERL